MLGDGVILCSVWRMWVNPSGGMEDVKIIYLCYQALGKLAWIFLTQPLSTGRRVFRSWRRTHIWHIPSFGSSDNSNRILLKQRDGFLLLIKRYSQSPPLIPLQIGENQVSGAAVVQGGHSNWHWSRQVLPAQSAPSPFGVSASGSEGSIFAGKGISPVRWCTEPGPQCCLLWEFCDIIQSSSCVSMLTFPA